MSRSKAPPIERDAALARNQVLVTRGILALANFCVNASVGISLREMQFPLAEREGYTADAVTLRGWCGRSYNLMLDVQSPLAV